MSKKHKKQYKEDISHLLQTMDICERIVDHILAGIKMLNSKCVLVDMTPDQIENEIEESMRDLIKLAILIKVISTQKSIQEADDGNLDLIMDFIQKVEETRLAYLKYRNKG